MVLEHVPQDAGLFVITGPVLNPEVLAGVDPYILYIVAIPEGLEDGVGKPENQDILDRLFCHVMINAKHLVFPEPFVDGLVQFPG